ncbi:MAG TPA: energy transducer TonB [Acidobacteriaceae bacterium]|jgi:TonB family protein|nr:energy transducer TonB [Acidobacteriaceae bacterium]
MAKYSSLNPQKNLTFGLLPEPERMNGAYTASAIINVCLLGLFVAISLIALHQKIVAKQQESLTLLMPLKPAAIPKPRPHVHVTPPPPELLRNIAPKIVFRHMTAENAPRMSQMKMRAPNAPVLPPYKPADVALPPQPKVGMFQSNVPTAVANNQGKPTTKTGGFGDPVGARTNPNSTSNQVAAYGSFQNSIGSENGAGSARKGSVHGVAFGSGYANGRAGGGGHGGVASTGFGNNVTGGTGHPQQGTVQMAGFHNDTTGGSGATPKLANTESEVTQVQILFHPRPEYTSEAKQMKIQGEVVLEVRFSADGKVEVLRVVHGLGHGLDEQAIHAAQQTRFKPAMKDGRPIDMTTYYRIDFQLA